MTITVQASPQQQALWDRLQVQASAGAGRPGPVVAAAFIAGPSVDLSGLKSAVRDVMANHSTLRTRFRWSDTGRLVVAVDDDVTLKVNVSNVANSLQAKEWLQQQVLTALRPEEGMLVAWYEAILSTGQSYVVIAADHIVFDAVSRSNFLKELGQAYRLRERGQAPEVARSSRDQVYASFVSSQKALLSGETFLNRREYWSFRLRGFPVRGEFSVSSANVDVVAAVVKAERCILDEDKQKWLQRGVGKLGCSIFVLSVAAVIQSFPEMCPGKPIRFVSPVANRSNVQELEAIGFYQDYAIVDAGVHPPPSKETAIENARLAVRAAQRMFVPFFSLVQNIEPDAYPRSEREHLSFLFVNGSINQSSCGLMGLRDSRDLKLEYGGLPSHPTSLSIELRDDGCFVKCYASGRVTSDGVDTFCRQIEKSMLWLLSG